MAFKGMFDEDQNEITTVTRRAIFDDIFLNEMQWYGQLDEASFVGRVFDIAKLPSTDRRFSNMDQDIWQHRINNYDWSEDWVTSDSRLGLMSCSDETFLNFLAQMVHPLVRSDQADIERFVALFNRHLAADGYQISPINNISGRRVFAGTRSLLGVHGGLTDARAIVDALSSEHMSAQLTRMRASLESDPAAAIGGAKEFVESLCKAILDKRGVARTGKEDFPKLCGMARESVGLKINPEADGTLKSLTGALATITGGLAELRGQMGTGHGGAPDTKRPPVPVARIAVHVATALGVFLWETHHGSASPQSKPWFDAADWDPA